MIFLLNTERVLTEIFNLSRFKLAQAFNIHPDTVTVTVNIEDGKFKPRFDLPEQLSAEYTTEEIQEMISRIWINLKAELFIRLRGLQERRNG